MGKYKGDVVTAANFIGGTYNGIVIESHAVRHLPNGEDPIATGTPSTLGTTNEPGSANSLIRSDHVHDHGSQSTPTHHAIVTTSANGFMSSSDKTKIDSVSSGATANATDAALRARASHTGTQLASTISDFSSATLGLALTGLSLLTGTPIVATDSILVSFGKIQKQITDLSSSKYDASNPNGYETPSQLNTRDTNNRARANHTGTQLAATISDFLSALLSSVLTGVVFTNSGAIVSTDTILIAFGKLQKQITDLAANPNGYETPTQLNARDTANRARANHTGTQTVSTISDFLNGVLTSVLTGVVFTASSAIVATDTLVVALGKLQKQITDLGTNKYDASNPSGFETPSQLNTRSTNDRARANHTGTQLSTTISDFLTAVLSSALTGISFASGTAITATDTVLSSLGKLQKQISDLSTSKYDASNPSGFETPTQLNVRDTANRSRTNHTGTQVASTISDFLTAVLSSALTGLSLATGTPITSSDTVISAFGKIQKQITDLGTNKYDASNPNSYETPTQLNARDTANRARANHTGTQLAATISDFASTTLGTILAGLSTSTSAVITTSDSIIGALGKLQAQLSAAFVSVVSSTIGTTNSAGTALSLARTDHVHAHGDQTVETLHAVSTQLLHGFMSSTDKTKLDHINKLYKTTANTASSSNTVNTSITDLTINCIAGTAYTFKIILRVACAATTTGPSIALTGTSAGSLAAHARYHTAATTAAVNTIVALNTNVVFTGCPTANTDYIVELVGSWVCTTSGTFLPAFRSEINGSAVTLKQYSVVEWTES